MGLLSDTFGGGLGMYQNKLLQAQQDAMRQQMQNVWPSVYTTAGGTSAVQISDWAIVPAPTQAITRREDSAVDWLDRRVNEMRVAL